MKQLIHYIFCPTSLENQFLIKFAHRMPIIVANVNLSLFFLFPKMQACNAVLQIWMLTHLFSVLNAGPGGNRFWCF